IRYASSSNRLYLEGGGCTNLTSIYNARLDTLGPKGPLYYFNLEKKTVSDTWTGTWFIDSDVFIEGDSLLELTGSDIGGDCDRLLMKSDDQGFIQIRAYGGRLLIENTVVTSWDMSAMDVDHDYEDGRSYISAISETQMTNPVNGCDGMAQVTKGEARMDIIKSEIAYLGWYNSESYGIAYKVRGLCKDLSNEDIFDHVKVTGDILNSHIHHLYFGHYSYGHQGGNWSYNVVHDNVGYGFDPHDDSDYVTINNNHVFNNGWHGIIASKRCDHVSIKNNIVHDNGYNGIMLHRSCNYSVITNNTAFDNGDSGLALYESSHVLVNDNYFYGNKHGIRWSMGSSFSKVYGNKIYVAEGEHTRYGLLMYRGNDIVGVPGTSGRPRSNYIYNNYVNHQDQAFLISHADWNVFENNSIGGQYGVFEDAKYTTYIGNRGHPYFEIRTEQGACF
ncbi:unnamed protein product, partial [Choristocarpus tenellus]